MKNTQKAFTLIELLVVIAIIGILASIILSSLSGARAKASNSRIISDIMEYDKAFALYQSSNNKFPGTNTLSKYCLGSNYDVGGLDKCDSNGGLSGGPGTLVNAAIGPYFREGGSGSDLPPIGNNFRVTRNDGSYFLGATYKCATYALSTGCTKATIVAELQGENLSCPRPHIASAVVGTNHASGGSTVCTITIE